jgi:hypothetical protein
VCLQAYLRLSCGLEILDVGLSWFCEGYRRRALWGVVCEGVEPLMVRVVENEGRAAGAEVGELNL